VWADWRIAIRPCNAPASSKSARIERSQVRAALPDRNVVSRERSFSKLRQGHSAELTKQEAKFTDYSGRIHAYLIASSPFVVHRIVAIILHGAGRPLL